MITLNLQTENDAMALKTLIDIAVKASGITGNVAKAGVIFAEMIDKAIEDSKVKEEQVIPIEDTK